MVLRTNSKYQIKDLTCQLQKHYIKSRFPEACTIENIRFTFLLPNVQS